MLQLKGQRHENALLFKNGRIIKARPDIDTLCKHIQVLFMADHLKKLKLNWTEIECFFIVGYSNSERHILSP